LKTGAPPQIGVLIVDAQPIYRAALIGICSEAERLTVLGSFGEGADAIAEVRRSAPSVVIVDLDLPDIGPDAFLHAVELESGHATRTLVLTSERSSGAIYAALASGANGYLGKCYVDGRSLVAAVCQVAEDGAVVSPELMRPIAAEIRLHAGDGVVYITQRERDVVRLVAAGCSVPEIARRLFLSQSTVKTHLGHLYRKLGVSDRAAAVAQAMKRGLVDAS
jgi:two-component system nitrate/nitrite response regulator NarL